MILVFVLLMGFGISACSTSAMKAGVPEAKPHADVQFDEFSRLPLGSSIKDIFTRFGEPRSALLLPDAGSYILVYQNNPGMPFRYYLEFDSKEKKLTGKTYEPLPNERVKSYKEMRTRFPGADFYSPPVSMCGSHYPRNEGLIWVWGTGVTMRIHPVNRTVSSISWGPVEQKPRTPAELPTGCPGDLVRPVQEIGDPRSLL